MKRTPRSGLVAILLLSTLTTVGWAHKPSDSYIRISTDPQLTIQWDISLRDLEMLVGLDSNGNGEITWSEVQSRRDEIEALALRRLRVAADGQNCSLAVEQHLVNRHSDGAYLVLVLNPDVSSQEVSCLTVNYDLLFDLDPTHRGLVRYDDANGFSNTYVLSPNERTIEIRSGEGNLWAAFVDYVREGIWHIWIGFDHILFLVALLLPAVLVRQADGWAPVEEFWPTCRRIFRIVTMFTVAHSITLWLAVMEYVTLPSQFIETVIAFSIVVTAINNIYPIVKLSGRWIAFGFGLIHGFGFANVLLDLGLSQMSLAVPLLGFNIGVELGQLVIVLAFLPLAYAVRATDFYSWGVLRLGSMSVAVLATIWSVERLFVVELIGI